jgi:hypothetical protein
MLDWFVFAYIPITQVKTVDLNSLVALEYFRVFRKINER